MVDSARVQTELRLTTDRAEADGRSHPAASYFSRVTPLWFALPRFTLRVQRPTAPV